MISSKTTGFYKNEDCPSSNELLEFQNGDLPGTQAREINKHLSLCDFCAAEVKFYARYPQDDLANEAHESSAIPASLYQLAEALLKNRHTDSSSLDPLLREMGGVVVDNV